MAWAERDGQYAQIEVAKKTAVARSWPKNFTAEDRMLTIHNALHNSKIDPEDVDIFTQRFEHTEGEVDLGDLTIITFPNFTKRKRFMEET